MSGKKKILLSYFIPLSICIIYLTFAYFYIYLLIGMLPVFLFARFIQVKLNPSASSWRNFCGCPVGKLSGWRLTNFVLIIVGILIISGLGMLRAFFDIERYLSYIYVPILMALFMLMLVSICKEVKSL